MDAAWVEGLVRRETLLLLLAHPQDVAGDCARLIARACAVGRPPLLAMLTDGCGGLSGTAADARARRLAAEAEAAAAALGLAGDRLLLMGLHEGTAPRAGWLFDRLAEALRVLMWRNDCGMIAAPSVDHGVRDQAAAAALADAVVAASGVARLILR